MWRPPTAAAVALLVALVAAATATAAPRPVASDDLGSWKARSKVRDRILDRMPVVARAAVATTEEYVDEHGHVITLSTDLPDVDLAGFAGLFASIEHGDEIEDLQVEVLAPHRVGEVCGPGAVACYLAEDPETSTRGYIWLPAVDEDLVHIAVHEYGHHVDNQLLNLAGLGVCSYDSDGSRNWFFERDVEDDILTETGCTSDTSWERLLGELFAEDFTILNGNTGWRGDMPVPPPTELQLDALAYDIANPFRPRRLDRQRTVKRGKRRSVPLEVENWTFLAATLKSPSRANFDLYLYAAGRSQPLARSRRPSGKDTVDELVPPGDYRLEVRAKRGAGRGRLVIDLD